MARLRVLLDEDIESDLATAFPKKATVHTVAGLRMSGTEDRLVVEEAIRRKCLIVTANIDFVPEYEHHDWRKGRDGRYFWGLIFLKPSKSMTRFQQLQLAIKAIQSSYDDIITVSAAGKISRKRLDGRRQASRSRPKK